MNVRTFPEIFKLFYFKFENRFGHFLLPHIFCLQCSGCWRLNRRKRERIGNEKSVRFMKRESVETFFTAAGFWCWLPCHILTSFVCFIFRYMLRETVSERYSMSCLTFTLTSVRYVLLFVVRHSRNSKDDFRIFTLSSLGLFRHIAQVRSVSYC